MNNEKPKNLTEQMLSDFTKIIQVQSSVLLQKDFITGNDDKTMILSMKLDYLGDKKIPIRNLKELIMILKLKLDKNVDIEFTDEFIEITDGSLKTIYRYDTETHIMHIIRIKEKKLNIRLKKSDEKIKINFTSEHQNTIKKSMNLFAEPMVAVKKTGDFLRFIIFDISSPQKCLYEALTIPIESNSMDDFDIALIGKNTLSSLFQTDYPFYICVDVKDNIRFIKFILEGETTYCISAEEPVKGDFDENKFSKFIDKYLKKSDNKKMKSVVEEAPKNIKKKTEEEAPEMEEEEAPKMIKKKTEEAPKSLDDIDINDFEDFDF